MSIGTVKNQERFLDKIAKQLGRERRREGVTTLMWNNQPQWGMYDGCSQDELVNILKEQCSIIHTDFFETSLTELAPILKDVVQKFGGGPVVSWKDSRYSEYGLKHLFTEENIELFEWEPSLGEKNIEVAEKANIGITFSDVTLAESGTVVLYSSCNKGRSVSLLPTTYIAIIPKSSIVPRITQAAHRLHLDVNEGKEIASCINFITGPSNSADIEMDLVVGVHGPIKAAYIVVNDK